MFQRGLILAVCFVCLSLNTAKADAPDDYQAGLASYQQKDYAKSIQSLKAAVKNDPKNWEAYQLMGNCYYQEKDIPDARDAFKKSLALHPNAELGKFAANLSPVDGSEAAPVQAGKSGSETLGLSQYEQGQSLIEKSRDTLRGLESTQTLSPEAKNIADYGMPQFSKDDNRFQMGLAVGSPVILGLDLGYSLNPMTNVGVGFSYIPSSEDTLYSIEPRIKFYSSPKDLSFFWGAGIAFGGYSDTYDPSQNSSWIGPNLKVGLSLINDGNFYFEMEWAIGFLIITNQTEVYNEYQDQYGNWNFNISYIPRTTFYPAAIPGTRIGLAF